MQPASRETEIASRATRLGEVCKVVVSGLESVGVASEANESTQSGHRVRNGVVSVQSRCPLRLRCPGLRHAAVCASPGSQRRDGAVPLCSGPRGGHRPHGMESSPGAVPVDRVAAPCALDPFQKAEGRATSGLIMVPARATLSRHATRVPPVLLVLGLLAACADNEGFLPPRTVKRKLVTPGVSGTPNPVTPVSDTQQNPRGLHLDPPAHWQAAPLGRFRLASFRAPSGVDISITAFPKAAGGVRGNVDRWLEQLGLPPLTQSGLAALPKQRILGTDAVLVDRQSADGARRLVGWIAPPAERQSLPGHTIFLKATGSPAALDEEFDHLVGFAERLGPAVGGVGSHGVDAATQPAPAPAAEIAQPEPRQPTSAPSPGEMRRLAWTVPEGWERAPVSGMRLGAWHPGGDPEVTVVASVLPGQAGAQERTYGMWAKGVGAALAPSDARDSIEVLGAKTTVCFETGERDAVLGVALHGGLSSGAREGDSLFLKALGPKERIHQLKPQFLAFCRSLEMR